MIPIAILAFLAVYVAIVAYAIHSYGINSTLRRFAEEDRARAAGPPPEPPVN